MTGMHVPSQILEAVDGTFLVLLIFIFGTTFQYMVKMTHQSIRTEGEGWRPNRWSIRAKASWALATIFFGLILRVGSHWSLRHAAGHGLHWEWLTESGPAIVLFSTVLTTWGSVCWIRTVIPLRFGAQSWTAATVLAVVFGVYMAM
jgi:hypothetical protein